MKQIQLLIEYMVLYNLNKVNVVLTVCIRYTLSENNKGINIIV